MTHLAKVFFNELINTLKKKYEFDISNIRGQGYDNRTNMKENTKDCKKRLLNINSRLFYTPCS